MKSGSNQRRHDSESVVPVSEFKARCLEILTTLRRRGRDLIVTKHGEPIARVVPIGDRKPLRGMLKGQLEISGDIVNADFGDEWEANK
jgi:prevent-host-death family protein